MNKEIPYLVYTSDLNPEEFFPGFEGERISSLDPRSALYLATGIAAQTKEMVLVLLPSTNASRSAFSGLTEAFYRNLPVILLTTGKDLDYSVEINDVVHSHHVLHSMAEFPSLDFSSLPMHVELVTAFPKGIASPKGISSPKGIASPKGTASTQDKQDFSGIVDTLKACVSEDDYLYLSPNIKLELDIKHFPCKLVRGGMEGCEEGALSSVLGASLARLRRRYIGLVCEEEFLHDMNALGNRHVNDSLIFFVLTKEHKQLIQGYAHALGFETPTLPLKDLSSDPVRDLLKNGKKSVVLMEGD